MKNIDNLDSLISVIIPVYNAELYLRNCINSIIGQTYSNFELILINDGSTDNSGTICDEYAANHKNIKVIHTINNGSANARNKGIDTAHGSYITFIDSDDSIGPDMFEGLYRNIIEYDADISVCGYISVYENFVIKHKFPDKEKLSLNEFFNRIIDSPDTYFDLFARSWNKLYKQSIISGKSIIPGQNNIPHRKIRFSSSLQMSEDIIFLVDYLSGIKKGIIVDEFTPYLYNEVLNINSKTKNISLEDRYNGLNYLKKLMAQTLPDKKHQIEKIIEYKYSLSVIKSIHNSFINKRHKLQKLSWHTVLIILHHSAILSNKLSALLLYFLPPSLYRLLFKLYCHCRGRRSY